MCCNERRYIIANERAVSDTTTRFETLLQLPPECGPRHLTLQSDDCIVVWRIVTHVDRVAVPYYVRTIPLEPAFISVPPDGADVQYQVISVSAQHHDPIAGQGGSPKPRVAAYCADMESHRESPLYAGEVETTVADTRYLLLGSTLPSKGSSGNTASWMWNTLTLPQGDYIVKHATFGSECVYDELSLEILQATVSHPARVWVDAEVKTAGPHSCMVGEWTGRTWVSQLSQFRVIVHIGPTEFDPKPVSFAVELERATAEKKTGSIVNNEPW